jgi:hypothetical protein
MFLGQGLTEFMLNWLPGFNGYVFKSVGISYDHDLRQMLGTRIKSWRASSQFKILLQLEEAFCYIT